MHYEEKERRLKYDLAFLAILAVILVAFIGTGYIYLLEEFIYLAMMTPYIIGRIVSEKLEKSRIDAVRIEP
jgi:hypothetical protein